MSSPARTLAEWTPTRRAVARRMADANRDVPQFHVTARIPIAAARAAAERSSESSGNKVTVTAVLLAAAVRALQAHPRLNAVWDDGDLYLSAEVNIGVAIAVDDGLVAPAILRAERLELVGIAEELTSLVDRARRRKLRPAELTDGTFTLSNLGMFDVSSFAAIVTPPQVAILAIGAATTAPTWNGTGWSPEPVIDATITCDHRAVDGVDAAKFLQTVRRELGDPASIERTAS